MTNKLWRVDDELLTLMEAVREDLHEDCPIGQWIPVTYGEGAYIYLESEDLARTTLEDCINGQIASLIALKKENGFV